MDTDEVSGRRIGPRAALAIVLIVGIGMLATGFISQTAAPTPEQPPAAVQPTEAPAPVEPEAPAPVENPEPEPSKTPTTAPAPAKPEPTFTREMLNPMGQSIWDVFQTDIVILDMAGISNPDANFNSRIVTDFDPTVVVGDERTLTVGISPYTSTYPLRVEETSPESGTIWSIVG